MSERLRLILSKNIRGAKLKVHHHELNLLPVKIKGNLPGFGLLLPHHLSSPPSPLSGKLFYMGYIDVSCPNGYSF